MKSSNSSAPSPSAEVVRKFTSPENGVPVKKDAALSKARPKIDPAPPGGTGCSAAATAAGGLRAVGRRDPGRENRPLRDGGLVEPPHLDLVEGGGVRADADVLAAGRDETGEMNPQPVVAALPPPDPQAVAA